MKKRWFAALSIPVFGLIVVWGTSNRMWRSSEAVAFADKGPPKVSERAVLDELPRTKSPVQLRESEPDFGDDLPSIAPTPVPSGTPRPSVSYPADGIDSLVGTDLSDEEKAKLAALREKVAELTKIKSELLNEMELNLGIARLEKTISDLHAAQRLLSAKQILSTLVEEFPDSPAALRANRMLEAANAMKSLRPPVPASIPKH